jgi:hypothetical protein
MSIQMHNLYNDKSIHQKLKYKQDNRYNSIEFAIYKLPSIKMSDLEDDNIRGFIIVNKIAMEYLKFRMSLSMNEKYIEINDAFAKSINLKISDYFNNIELLDLPNQLHGIMCDNNIADSIIKKFIEKNNLIVDIPLDKEDIFGYNYDDISESDIDLELESVYECIFNGVPLNKAIDMVIRKYSKQEITEYYYDYETIDELKLVVYDFIKNKKLYDD